MPICFLVFKDNQILFDKKVPIADYEEIEQAVNFTLMELNDIYHWNFEVEEARSIKEVSNFIDTANRLTMKVFVEQFTEFFDFTEGSLSNVLS